MVQITRLLAPVVALSSALSGVWATPIAEADGILEARQGGRFAVTGVREGGNAPRLEIRQLASTGRQWNLFLQALTRLKGVDQGTLTSYYSIASIHGQPRTWDGVGGGGGSGYCPHSSNLFGPWHRPYLALFEQRLQFHAVNIANSYPAGNERNAYRAAAATLRLPFWDWARNQLPVMPGFFTSQGISITNPSGQQQTIFNPLYAYRFHPLRPNDFGNARPFSVYTATKRWPDGTGANANSQNSRVEANLRGSAGSYRSRVFNLFARQQSYNHFSNHGSGSDGDTLESVHDNIHSSFGPNSHMTFVSFSSHDPIFFFHHCNIDRILALWQRLYPNTYVEPFRQSGGTYTIGRGSTQDANSPLTPFHRDANGAFWTSNTVRNVNTFGYTYPEIADNPSASTLRGRINNLYGPQAAGVSRNVANNNRNKLKTRTLDNIHVDINLDISPGETLYQYVAQVTMPLNPLGGTYSLALFFGDHSTEPAAWQTDPNFVGAHSILGMRGMIDTETLVTGEVILTQPLLKKYAAGELKGLDQDSVIKYVHDHMSWAIEQNGDAIDSSRIPDVSVTLLSNLIKAPESSTAFPTLVDTTPHGNVTEDVSPNAS